ncbi:MAG: hypothetical protein H7210_13160 [Pyrinomonadaceae bacterium]|nr:hypothetical protein [Phycisphaerales bacterium]
MTPSTTAKLALIGFFSTIGGCAGADRPAPLTPLAQSFLSPAPEGSVTPLGGNIVRITSGDRISFARIEPDGRLTPLP